MLIEVLGVILDVVRFKRDSSVQTHTPCTSLGMLLYENSYEKEIQIALLETKRRDCRFSETILSALSPCHDSKDLIQKVLEHIATIFPYASSAVVIAEPEGNYMVRISKNRKLERAREDSLSEFLANELMSNLESPLPSGQPQRKHSFFYDSRAIVVKSNHYGVLLWLGYEARHSITSKELLALKAVGEHVLSVCQAFDRYHQKNKAISAAEDESEKKSSFLSQISHDIRSPLSTVQTVLSLLARDPAQAGDAKLISGAQANIDLVRDMVEDLVKFAQLKSGVLSAEKRFVDLCSIVNSCVQSVRPSVQDKQLTIQFVSDVTKAEIFADAKHIRRVLMNLLSNAYKYTVAGGVVVRLYVEQGVIFCSVTDTGIGMTQESCQRLYEPFSRFCTEVDGAGLGLYISKGLCELNGVRLEVLSTLGEGSSFTLIFDPSTWEEKDCPSHAESTYSA
jgi:signal transduction histidine kinase